MSLFKFYWRQPVVEAVSAFWGRTSRWNQKHLRGLPACAVDLSPDPLPLQQLEKLSATALSWQLRRRLMLPSKFLAFRKLC